MALESPLLGSAPLPRSNKCPTYARSFDVLEQVGTASGLVVLEARFEVPSPSEVVPSMAKRPIEVQQVDGPNFVSHFVASIRFAVTSAQSRAFSGVV